MADERFSIADDMRKRGRLEQLPGLTQNPIRFFQWLLSRALAGESLEEGLSQLELFQQGFPLVEFDFANLRRHLSVAAAALLVGRPVGRSAAEALSLAHRTWDGGRADLDTAIEGCGAAICARDDAELAIWQERARRKVSLDWAELFEEALFLMDPRAANVSLPSLATSSTRVLAEGIQSITVSAAPLVAALWRCVDGRAPLDALLAGRARSVDDLVFGPIGEEPLVKIGKPYHEVTDTEEGPALLLGLEITGRGPLSPGGYSIAPFTYQLAELIDRVGRRLGHRAEIEGKQQMAMIDEALERRDHAVTFRLQIGRGVDLSQEDAEAFRARIEHSWAHARLSMLRVHAEARVEVTR